VLRLRFPWPFTRSIHENHPTRAGRRRAGSRAGGAADGQRRPTLGLDPTGTGTYTTYADLWTNVTDTGLATGFIPGRIVGPGAPRPT
jgi:hypothetical protein